jgi:hypothetical protein
MVVAVIAREERAIRQSVTVLIKAGGAGYRMPRFRGT